MNRGQIRLLNSKTTDLDRYYSRPNQKLKFLIRDLLCMPFVNPLRLQGKPIPRHKGLTHMGGRNITVSSQYSIVAIKKFLEQANAFPSRTSSDIVADYCRSSEECEEICRLLEGKRKASEVFSEEII